MFQGGLTPTGGRRYSRARIGTQRSRVGDKMSNLSLREAQQHAQAHARRILDAVRQGARAAGDDDVMASSWTRCLNEHRLHPDHPRRPSVVSAAELAERQNRLADVLDCARYEMSTLYQQLGDGESAVVLTDTDGVILHMVTSARCGAKPRRAPTAWAPAWSPPARSRCSARTISSPS